MFQWTSHGDNFIQTFTSRAKLLCTSPDWANIMRWEARCLFYICWRRGMWLISVQYFTSVSYACRWSSVLHTSAVSEAAELFRYWLFKQAYSCFLWAANILWIYSIVVLEVLTRVDTRHHMILKTSKCSRILYATMRCCNTAKQLLLVWRGSHTSHLLWG